MRPADATQAAVLCLRRRWRRRRAAATTTTRAVSAPRRPTDHDHRRRAPASSAARRAGRLADVELDARPRWPRPTAPIALVARPGTDDPVRGRAGGAGAARSSRRHARRARSLDISRRRRHRRRAGPARHRVLARRRARSTSATAWRPTATPASTRTTMAGDDGRHRRRAASCWRSSSRSPTTTAATSSSGPTATSTSALGDGGGGGDPEGNGQDTAGAARQDPAHRPRPAAARRAPTASPPTTRSPTAQGGAPEVWLYGVRNPWRFTFDRRHRRPVDRRRRPERSGRRSTCCRRPTAAAAAPTSAGTRWRAPTRYEGGTNPDGGVLPVFEYDHSDGGCSVTGGVVYRGAAIPGLDGAYLFTRLLRRARCGPSGPTAGRSSTSARSTTHRAPTWSRSARTPPARSTCCRWTAPIYRLGRPAERTSVDAPGRRRDPAHRHARPSGPRPCGPARSPPPSLATEGFVHCSTRDQLRRHARPALRRRRPAGPARARPRRHRRRPALGGEHAGRAAFPHVYAPIPVAAVMAVEQSVRRPHADRRDGDI